MFFAVLIVMLANCKSDPIPVNEVSMAAIAFKPKTLNISVGTTITWVNNDLIAHTVTSDTTGLFDSGNMEKKATFKHTFTKVGTFPYHCDYHSTMKGTIVVAAKGSGM